MKQRPTNGHQDTKMKDIHLWTQLNQEMFFFVMVLTLFMTTKVFISFFENSVVREKRRKGGNKIEEKGAF